MKLIPALIAAACLLANHYSALAQGNACSGSAWAMSLACGAEIQDDYAVELVICANIVDENDAAECWEDAQEDFAEATEECAGQAEARYELCGKLGEAPYDVSDFWEQENFADPMDIGVSVEPNPYFSLVQGSTDTYFDGDETIIVTVTSETKLIEGVTCLTVNDLVQEDGLNVEDTDDWYAQDLDGNVWYCGEISLNYEFFEGDDPEVAELTDIEGSWKGFRDGALPGISIPADPQPGDVYRQEIAWGDAEDVAEVLTITGDALLEEDACEDSHEEVAAFIDEACAEDCLITLEYTAIEPGVFAHKYYAPGVGLIAEVEDGGCLAPEGIIED